MARLLDDVGALPPLVITFVRDEDPPYVILATLHQLTLADQRLAVDQIAARLGCLPKVHEVLAGRYGASVRGRWESTFIIVVTNAAPPMPGTPDLPERTTATSDIADTLRSLADWAGKTAQDVNELVVTEHSRTCTVHAMVADDAAAQRVLDGLVPDDDFALRRPGRRYRSLLPTGHLLSVTVDPK